MDKMKKALWVIEGSILMDEPENKRLSFIYRMAHAGIGRCEHEDWNKELDSCYEKLLADNIISPEPQFNNVLEADAHNWDDREIKP